MAFVFRRDERWQLIDVRSGSLSTVGAGIAGSLMLQVLWSSAAFLLVENAGSDVPGRDHTNIEQGHNEEGINSDS